MSCRRASQLISESLDRPLTRRERLALRLHLLICGFCRRYKRQLLLLRQTLQKSLSEDDQPVDVAHVTLSAEARRRISQAISRDL